MAMAMGDGDGALFAVPSSFSFPYHCLSPLILLPLQGGVGCWLVQLSARRVLPSAGSGRPSQYRFPSLH